MAPKKKDIVSKSGFTSKDIESQIFKKYGDSVQVGALNQVKDVISTGSLTMDIASGIGGIPRGRITEFSGLPSTGKTYRALMIARSIQRKGGNIAIIDTEFATDPPYLESLGIDMSPDRFKVFYPENLETAGELTVDLCESGLYHCIVFDSVGGAPFKAQQDGDIGDANMMARARIMSTFMPKVNGPVYRNGIFMIFTNQLRSKPPAYKNDPDIWVAPGGNALPFHASMRIFLRSRVEKEEKATDSTDVERVLVTGEFKKNKCAPPFRKFDYDLDFTTMETDYYSEMADILCSPRYIARLGITKNGPSWLNIPSELVSLGFPEKVNGTGKMKEFLMKELEATGSTEVVDAVDVYIRTKLIHNYDPNHVIDFNSVDMSDTIELYEGSED